MATKVGHRPGPDRHAGNGETIRGGSSRAVRVQPGRAALGRDEVKEWLREWAQVVRIGLAVACLRREDWQVIETYFHAKRKLEREAPSGEKPKV